MTEPKVARTKERHCRTFPRTPRGARKNVSDEREEAGRVAEGQLAERVHADGLDEQLGLGLCGSGRRRAVAAPRVRGRACAKDELATCS